MTITVIGLDLAKTVFQGHGIDETGRGVRKRWAAVGRRNWTFAGSDEGGRRAAAMDTLIETCTLNDVDPRAGLKDVLDRLSGSPAKRRAELLPSTPYGPARR